MNTALYGRRIGACVLNSQLDQGLRSALPKTRPTMTSLYVVSVLLHTSFIVFFQLVYFKLSDKNNATCLLWLVF